VCSSDLSTGGLFGGSDKDITYGDFYVYPCELWCINQNIATSYETIDDDFNGNYGNSKINCFDFVSFICSCFGLVLNPTDYGTFTLTTHNASIYTVNNDDKYDYEYKDVESEIDACRVEFYCSNGDFLFEDPPYNNPYVVATENAITLFFWSGLSGGESIDYYRNCIIYFRNPDNPSQDKKWFLADANDELNEPTHNIFNPCYYKIHPKVNGYAQETIVTKITTDIKNVLSHYINIKDRTSEIIQVTYE